MLTMQDIQALAAANAGAFTTEIEPFTIGGRTLETDNEPLIMGVVNRSRDSTYRDSVAPTPADAVRRARILFHQGAHVIDIGAESSRAGGLRVSTHDQIDALNPVVEELSAEQIPVSIESYDVDVIQAAVRAGACVVNLTGTRDDDAIFDIIGSAGASLLMCFTPGETVRDELSIRIEADPIPALIEHFEPRIEHARSRGVRSIAIDAGLGFFYGPDVDPISKIRHQAQVLLHSFRLRSLGVPSCQVMPHAFDVFQEEFRSAEGVFAVLGFLGRVGILRVHEVARVRASLELMRTIDVEL